MDFLKKVCSLCAVSGFEHSAAETLKQMFENIFDESYVDRIGNVTGYMRCGKKGAPLAMFESHLDSIGLMVTKIYDGGFVSFISIGGVDPRILPGNHVILHGKKDILGICGAKPPHILSADDMKVGVKMEDLLIDTGYSKGELEKIIEIGTPITIAPSHFELGENCFCGSYLDDRAGIYAVVEAAKELKKSGNLNADICVLISTTEETGQYGARCAASRIDPDVAVVVDVTHAETPDGIKSRTSPAGEGGVVCLGPNLSKKHNDILFDALDKKEIKYQIEVEEGSTGTNAWVIQTSASGIPCVLISIPLKYMHTNIEVVDKRDLKAVSDSIVCFVNALYGGGENND